MTTEVFRDSPQLVKIPYFLHQFGNFPFILISAEGKALNHQSLTAYYL